MAQLTHGSGCDCDQCGLVALDAFIAARQVADRTANDRGYSIHKWLEEEWATDARLSFLARGYVQPEVAR